MTFKYRIIGDYLYKNLPGALDRLGKIVDVDIDKNMVQVYYNDGLNPYLKKQSVVVADMDDIEVYE